MPLGERQCTGSAPSVHRPRSAGRRVSNLHRVAGIAVPAGTVLRAACTWRPLPLAASQRPVAPRPCHSGRQPRRSICRRPHATRAVGRPTPPPCGGQPQAPIGQTCCQRSHVLVWHEDHSISCFLRRERLGRQACWWCTASRGSALCCAPWQQTKHKPGLCLMLNRHLAR